MTKPLTRRKIAAPIFGSSTNSASGFPVLYADSIDPKDQPLLSLTWDYDHEGPPVLPDGSVSRIEGEPDGRESPARDQRPRLGPKRPADRQAETPRTTFPSERTTARLPAAAGSTSGVSPPRPEPRPRPGQKSGQPAFTRNGAMPGRITGAFCTTARSPTPKASPGRSAKSTSGGMRRQRNGPGTTSLISSRRRPPTYRAPMAQKAWRQLAGTSRSS